ncbi:DedA family protein [Rhodoluna sp. KAS3]|uniref:DedA family protein n=1 Tax=Rhodoluna sp. KAS3 TaxID=942880 RepID=UPI0022327A8C|nr:DedA family protein [Rhodoluna sp. KAS3]
MNEILDWILNMVQSVDPATRNLLAGLAIMLETSLFIGLIMPGDTVVLVASTGVLDLGDFFFLLGAVLLGSLIGESVGFLIGRFFGERIRASRLGQKIGEKNWQMADVFVETRGGLAVAISRFLPVLHSLVPVVSGMTRMKYRVFIRWTVAACAVWASAYVGVGYLARASYEEVSKNLKFGGLVFVVIIIAFVVLVHFGKKRLEKSAERMIAEGEAAMAAIAGAEQIERGEENNFDQSEKN